MTIFKLVHACTEAKWRLLLCLLLAFSSTSNAFCFDQAAARYEVNPTILQAIARHESRLKAWTVTQNSNQTQDIGLMGINTVHLIELAKYGISRESLQDACINVEVGAWLLKKKILRWGNTWQAVGAYHSETDIFNRKYQEKIMAEVVQMQKSSIRQ